ncbi:MAG: DM13 domain-containing protein [Anaerolineae bacterium]|nr:DM13 domain-containing protein [Anaerolineae bacterium]
MKTNKGVEKIIMIAFKKTLLKNCIALATLYLVGCGAPAITPAPTQGILLEPTTAVPSSTLTPAPLPTDIQPTETQVTEVPPTDVPSVVILSGKFEGVGQGHSGSGSARITQRPDGTYFLRFENFSVCCGPDLYVFLATKSSVGATSEFGNYVELSSLQSITGDQAYEIPQNTDMAEIKSVVIYCKPFKVIIASATLN